MRQTVYHIKCNVYHMYYYKLVLKTRSCFFKNMSTTFHNYWKPVLLCTMACKPLIRPWLKFVYNLHLLLIKWLRAENIWSRDITSIRLKERKPDNIKTFFAWLLCDIISVSARNYKSNIWKHPNKTHTHLIQCKLYSTSGVHIRNFTSNINNMKCLCR